jgi:glycerol-3-phosphate dehydrogenase
MPGAFDRPDALHRLTRTAFDVVVVGGGITGAGCALDAASRGLRTALIERDDFASGTSSRSSKMIHGGLRYLQQGEVRLVYEALHERSRLMANAPHLVKVLPFLLPVLKGRDGVVPPKLARALGSALWAYDLTGGARIGRLHKRLSAEETLAHMPTLRRDRLASSYVYYDARADDARLTLTLARTAVLDHGAVIANGTTVVGITKGPDGRITGVTAEAGGHRFEISATAVVNATGVWSDDVRALDEGDNPHSIRPAKGIHLSVPWSLIRNDIAAVLPVPRDRRSIFVVPWGSHTYAGTTDTDYDGPIDDPQCTPEDVEYILRTLSSSLDVTISPDDVTGTWAGLRPLVQEPASTTSAVASGRTADLSRRHRVQVSASGLVTITGGKLTTYREMAEDTIDRVLAGTSGTGRWRTARRSRTRRLPLRGAQGYQELRDATRVSPAVPDAVAAHLVDRYGGEAHTLVAMVERDRSLGEALVAGLPYIKAEAVYAARYEMARNLDDILSRRTRARLLARDASARAAPEVAALVADDLGWDRDDQAEQVAEYRAGIERERDAADLPEILDRVVGA